MLGVLVALWAPTYIIITGLHGSPFVNYAICMVAGGVFLFCFRRDFRRSMLFPIVVTALGYEVVPGAAIYVAAQHLHASLVALASSTFPLFMAIVQVVTQRRPLHRAFLPATLAALVFLWFAFGKPAIGAPEAPWLLLILAATSVWALSTAAIAMPSTTDEALSISGYGKLVAGVLLLAFLPQAGVPPLTDVAWDIAMGLLASGVGAYVFVYLVRSEGAAFTGLIEPLNVATVLAADALTGVFVTATQLVGTAGVLACTAISVRTSALDKAKDAP